jgi:hypothetical protein
MSIEPQKKLPEPNLIHDLFSREEHEKLVQALRPELYRFKFDDFFQRFYAEENQVAELNKAIIKLVPLARSIFKSEYLLPTYALFAHYIGPNAQLPKHKDDNACTYTIDYCLYQNINWDLWIEEKPFSLKPNDALVYSGTDQLHWREKFPGKNGDHVAMIFFHFAEPGHWYFTEGPEHIDLIRMKRQFEHEQKKKK